jgi:hypothetical protein
MLASYHGTLSIRGACLSLVAVLLFALPYNLRAQQNQAVLIPHDLEFAKDLVRDLNESGFDVKSVRYSKLNGGELWTKDAVWIKTEKGIFEAVFYNDPNKPSHVVLTELPSKPGFHEYKITLDQQSRRWAGSLPVFFNSLQKCAYRLLRLCARQNAHGVCEHQLGKVIVLCQTATGAAIFPCDS